MEAMTSKSHVRQGVTRVVLMLMLPFMNFVVVSLWVCVSQTLSLVQEFKVEAAVFLWWGSGHVPEQIEQSRAKMSNPSQKKLTPTSTSSVICLLKANSVRFLISSVLSHFLLLRAQQHTGSVLNKRSLFGSCFCFGSWSTVLNRSHLPSFWQNPEARKRLMWKESEHTVYIFLSLLSFISHQDSSVFLHLPHFPKEVHSF